MGRVAVRAALLLHLRLVGVAAAARSFSSSVPLRQTVAIPVRIATVAVAARGSTAAVG